MSRLNRAGDGHGVISTNSSTTLLTNGSTFTGEWENVQSAGTISVAVKTDQNGTFSVQFSPDGTNVDSTLTRYYRTSHIEAPHVFSITRKFARVVFTNDSGSDQTFFRLQTLIGDRPQLNAPGDSTLAQDFDSVSVRPSDFHYEVAEGLRQGYTTWNKWGYNPDVDIGTETIWTVGGLFTKMTTADTLNVVSTSTDDDGDPAGLGAQTIIITGVDANYDEQIEIVTMDGVTPVTTTSSWLGVNRVAVYAVGGTGYNVGDITLTVTTGGAPQAQIPATEGSTQQALVFIPRKHRALMDWMYINAVKTAGGASPQITVRMFVYSDVSGARYEVFRTILDTAHGHHVELKPAQPFVVGEQSLVEMQATTDKADTAISVRFSYILVRDKDALN